MDIYTKAYLNTIQNPSNKIQKNIITQGLVQSFQEIGNFIVGGGEILTSLPKGDLKGAAKGLWKSVSSPIGVLTELGQPSLNDLKKQYELSKKVDFSKNNIFQQAYKSTNHITDDKIVDEFTDWSQAGKNFIEFLKNDQKLNEQQIKQTLRKILAIRYVQKGFKEDKSIQQLIQNQGNQNTTGSADQNLIKQYLVSDEQKKVLAKSLQNSYELKTYDQLMEAFKGEGNFDEIKVVAKAIKVGDLIYDYSPVYCYKTGKPDAPTKLIEKVEIDQNGTKAIRAKVIGILPDQRKALMGILQQRVANDGAAQISAQAIKSYQQDPNQQVPAPDKAQADLLRNTPAYQNAKKKLKLRDQEDEGAFMGIFAKLFALLFGGNNSKKYKEYSDQQLMSFARYTKAAVQNGAIPPGTYKFKFRG